MIPVPGLDGFHVLRDAFPDTFYKYEDKFYQYQMIIMVLLVIGGGRIISIPSNALINMMLSLASSFARLF